MKKVITLIAIMLQFMFFSLSAQSVTEVKIPKYNLVSTTLPATESSKGRIIDEIDKTFLMILDKDENELRIYLKEANDTYMVAKIKYQDSCFTDTGINKFRRQYCTLGCVCGVLTDYQISWFLDALYKQEIYVVVGIEGENKTRLIEIYSFTTKILTHEWNNK